MSNEKKANEDLEQRNELPEYEAPKLDVIGKVEQLSSEFDGITQTPR